MYAMMLSTSDDMFAEELWTHLSDIVEVSNNRLFFFCGKPINSPISDEHYSNVIFTLMLNFPMDGLIVSGDSLSKYIGVDALNTYISRYGDVPIVSMNVLLESSPSVLLNNMRGSYLITKHIVEQHRTGKIGYITGQMNRQVVQERYEGFLKAVTQGSGRQREYLVKHGEFSKATGYVLGLEMIKEGVDCIICAHDIIAIGVYDAVKSFNLRIPEDITVLGFGDLEEAKLLSPPLTTVSQSFSELAKRAYDVILRDSESSVLVPELVLRQSCGCHINSECENLESIKSRYRNAIDSYRISIELSNAFNHINNLEDLNKALYAYFKDFKGTEFYLCLFNEGVIEIEDPYTFEYPKMMNMAFGYNHGVYSENIQFEAREGLPDEIYHNIKASTFLVYPINLNQKCYGFLFSDAHIGKNLNFIALRNILNNTINRIFSYKELEEFANKDSLTGVLNRRGFFVRLEDEFNRLGQKDGYPVILYADVNGLKQVNDQYGHATGDDLIVAASRLLQNYFPKGIISRVGGDEFIIYLEDMNSEALTEVTQQFNDQRIHMVLDSKKSVVLTISIGYCYYDSNKHKGLSRWIDEADQNLYMKKRSR